MRNFYERSEGVTINPESAHIMCEKQSGGRLHYLDTVRGFAALAVLWSHFALGFGLPGFLVQYQNTPLQIFWDGIAGVSMFFVLSGCVLSLKYFNPTVVLPPSGSAFNIEGLRFDLNEIICFYIKRIFRIFPPFLFVLILSILSFQYLYQIYPTAPDRSAWTYSLWKDAQISTPLLIRQALLVFPETVHTLVPQAWSLTLEMQFSLMMPFLILAAYKSIVIFTLSVIILSTIDLIFESLLGGHISILFISLFHFYLGLLLSKYYRQLNLFICQASLCLKCFTVLSGLLLFSFRGSLFPLCSEFFPLHAIPYCNALGSFLILLSCMGFTNIQRFLTTPFFHFAGKISYSLYLCHVVVLIIITPVFIKWVNQSQIDGATSHILALLFATVTSLFIATLLYYLVERPSIRAGLSIIKWTEALFLLKGRAEVGRSVV